MRLKRGNDIIHEAEPNLYSHHKTNININLI